MKTHEPTSVEFILRVRVPMRLADVCQEPLKRIATTFKGTLSRVERADYETHSIHVRRKKIV